MAHTAARAGRAAKRAWQEPDQWAVPVEPGASVEETKSRPPYTDLESDPASLEPWVMPGELGEQQ